MARTLALVSPHLKGPDVLALQKSLKNNRFAKSYYDGDLDSEYGPLTAQAVYRAEYWVGVAKPDQKTSGNLKEYLDGDKPLTMLMRRRRAKRIARLEKSTPLRVKLFKQALTQVGTKESPAGSNMQKYGAWYGWNGVAWCAIFQSWAAFFGGGSVNVKRGQRWAYCPYVYHDALAGANGLSITKTPKRGDWVLFDWDKNGVANHIEAFDEWVVEGSTFKTIGGNTSPTNASNGGAVVHYGVGGMPVRNMSDVQAFVHLSK